MFSNTVNHSPVRVYFHMPRAILHQPLSFLLSRRMHARNMCQFPTHGIASIHLYCVSPKNGDKGISQVGGELDPM